jgi:hypothetical protein
VCRTRDRFGAHEAKRVLYYEGVEKYARIDPGSKQCYTTLYLHPDNGVLAFVTNLSPDKQAVKMTFQLDELGLEGGNVELLDTMHNRKLSLGRDGSVSLDLDTERWTYLWLKPAAPVARSSGAGG